MSATIDPFPPSSAARYGPNRPEKENEGKIMDVPGGVYLEKHRF
jgi:hypothetical protein